jgi:EmrB/QacA subfamily drug resistance transporter
MAQTNPHHERRWWILSALCVAQMMVVLDATIVNIALPSAQQDLGFSNDDRQWIITAYTLAFGSLLLLGGKLGDLFGRKRTLIVGLCGFAIGSGVGGLSTSFLMLAAARATQGAFGALLAPSALALLTTTFTEPADRNRAFGIFGGVVSSGASVGLLLGGALTEWIDWRAVMYVNVVIALFPLTAALAFLVNQRAAEKPHIDLGGTLTVTGGLFALVYGFSHAATTSWGNPLTLAALAAGVVLLALFLVIEARVADPLLPLRILIDRDRGASYLTIVAAAGALLGTFLFLTYYLQGIRDYSPIRTGLAFLPMTLVMMVTSIIGSTILQPRVGARALVVIGLVLSAIAMLYLTRIAVASSYVSNLLPSLLVVGIGLGLVFATAINSATLGVRQSDAGVASATANASQQIGASLGTALLSTVAVSATTSYLKTLQPSATVVARASVHGYAIAFAWSAAIFAVGAVLAAVTYKGGKRTSELPPAADAAAAPAYAVTRE